MMIDASDPEVVGKVNAGLIKKHEMKRGMEDKLTCTLDTCGKFMSFSSYYLFFLIDYCHLVIDEFKEISVFYKTDCFNRFVTTLMSRRIGAMKLSNKGMEKYCKMILNSCYGFNIKNNENYGKVKLCTWKQAMMAQGRNNFLHTGKINDDLFMVYYRASTFKCHTCIQLGFFTLDNAKFAYLMFYYEFLTKCMDMNRIHAVEGDTDSLYFAVAGNPRRGIRQGFQYVVKDRAFCRKHYYEWFPSWWGEKEDEKKLGGVAFEKIGDFQIANASKNYTIGVKGNEKKATKKMKGCSEKRNEKKITVQSYFDNIDKKVKIEAENCGFHVKDGTIVKDLVNKVAISGVHTKMIVLENECCAPYIYGLNANDYSVQ
ncbi:hypothetical protein FACS189472_06940 [Alphaproteobacteria bacterium]|nr:hypothetical protein FACS189472_06940 [Alphaproteobacteria bacterium]